MKKLGKSGFLLLAGCLLGTILGQSLTGYGQDGGRRSMLPRGVHVDLTSDFYKALKEEGDPNTKSYSSDPSVAYLREISIAARYTVETNLQLLKNQERIIQLLESGRR